MLIDDSPVFLKWAHRNNIASIDRPKHWQILDEHPEILLVSFQPPDSPGTIFSLAAIPCNLPDPESSDTAQLQQHLKSLFSDASVDQHLGPCSLLCYPSHSVQLTDGSFAFAAIHQDLAVIINTHCPPDELHIYQPVFERMLSSFRISRRRHGRLFELRAHLIKELRRRAPNTDCQPAHDHIKFGRMQIFVENLLSAIDQQPHMSAELIDRFVETTLHFASNSLQLGEENWDSIRSSLFPMVRPDSIIHSALEAAGTEVQVPGSPQQIVATPWLANLVTCYAVDSPQTLRFIVHGDLHRWGITETALHQQAMENLQKSTAPEIVGVPSSDGGLLVGMPSQGPSTVSSAWILHPRLHEFVRSHFRGRIWAGIPNRDTIVLFAADNRDRQALLQKLQDDYLTSHHSISDRLFEITPDGIVLA